MTLDDFFKLTEMNNGLTSPSRVRELMTVMQKERDGCVKNASDATRHWSAVARVIAATENKECLDIFIQSDGLHFISKWLNDAQNFTDDTVDSSVEDSIIHLLQVLEQLRATHEDLVGSEIWMIVEKLFVHNSTKVQDSARGLFERWKTNRDGSDVSLSDAEKTKTSTVDGAGAGKSADSSILGGISLEEKNLESTKDDPAVSTNSNSIYEVKSVDNSEKIVDPSAEGERSLYRLGSPSHAVDGVTHTTEVGSLENSLAGDKKLHDGDLSFTDARSVDSEEGTHHSLSKSSSSEQSSENSKDSDNLVSDTEDVKPSAYGIDNHLATNSGSGKTQLRRAGKKSDDEIHYGIVDPLEVARLVAMEVERDCREDSSSSSEKLPGRNIQQPSSPDSAVVVAKSSPMQRESASSSENVDGAQTNETGDAATSQVTVAAQEEAANIEKCVSNFDLNQDVCSEDRNNFPASISIVSASRAAASPGLPCTPLQFEGTLGWKGSAATSAFRAASPRHVPGCSSRLREGRLDFDLNVAENGVGDASQDKPPLVLSSLASGESSAETNSRRSEHLELDLNRASEEGQTAPSDIWVRQFFPRDNRSHSLSSSSKQPIDLNDQPSFLNGPSNNSYLRKVSPKSDDSVISIMGTRVEVNQKDFVFHPQQMILPNGQTAFDANFGRTANFLGMGSILPFPQSSTVYGYNNMAAPVPVPVPTMPPSTVYGSGGLYHPYMVDSRGAPVIPQIMAQPPPFVINMNPSTPSNGVVGPMQGSFYPNPGYIGGSGSKNSGGLGLFLNSNQFRSVEEQGRPNNLQIVGQKRKEAADNGWEQYPFIKHFTPP